jgi:phosphoglycolate phosphatase-like HAD superfamily hydrolase
VKAALDRLAWRGYSLALASLTDEERIEKTLKIANIACINTIVGRSEYKNRELSNYLAEKIYLIRKIANLAGIPASRVLYIGDHHRTSMLQAKSAHYLFMLGC